MLIGYARVSTDGPDQTTDLQRDALIKAGVDPRHLFESLPGFIPRPLGRTKQVNPLLDTSLLAAGFFIRVARRRP